MRFHNFLEVMNSHIFGMQTDAQSAYKPFWLQYTKTRQIFHQGFFQFWNDIYSSNFVITITHQKKLWSVKTWSRVFLIVCIQKILIQVKHSKRFSKSKKKSNKSKDLFEANLKNFFRVVVFKIAFNI